MALKFTKALSGAVGEAKALPEEQTNTRDYFLGELDELTMLSIARLNDHAYGVTLKETIEEVTGRTTSIGAIYASLERLERKGFVEARQGDPTPERGGRAKRFYKVTGLGQRALSETQQARAKLTRGSNLELGLSGGML